MTTDEQEYASQDGDVAAMAGAVMTGPGLPGITAGRAVRWEGGGHAACDAEIARLTAELASARSAAASDRGRAKAADEKLAAIVAYCQAKADDFSASMPMRVRPQDMRISAGDVLAIISGDGDPLAGDGRERMRADLLALLNGPVRDWAMSMVPDTKTTYGVDVVGKIAALVRDWPDTSDALTRISAGSPGWEVPHVIREAVTAERARIALLAEEYGAVYPTCPCDTQAGGFAEHPHGSPAPFAALIREQP